MYCRSCFTLSILFITISCSRVIDSIASNVRDVRRSSCTYEMENANRTIGNWSSTMNQMLTSESDSAQKINPISSAVLKEGTKIQDAIASFGVNMNKKPIEQLVKDLVSIRRRSNRMALDIYLKTFDMRWPQTSVQLGVAVERVQQACISNLDRVAMLVLTSPHAIGATSLQKHRSS